MQDYSGNINFPIWLVADSEPKNWQSQLDSPLDPRHPARHSIWTPVLDYMQDYFYRNGKRRFDTKNLYIRNAVKNPSDKPEGAVLKWPQLETEVKKPRSIMDTNTPKVILTFGAFAFEFLRRACDESPQRPYVYWGAANLGNEFKRRIHSYNKSQTNIFPLLHVSIARGKFLESHRYFVGEEKGNYFAFVGIKLGQLFSKELITEERIWIK